MNRRELIAGLGASAFPVAARTQQALPTIGFLDSGARVGMEANLAAFHRGLRELGFTESQNIAIEYRWAEGQYGRLPALAAELVARQVAVISATRSPAPGLAAKAATSTIPIVFQTGSDPVKDGLVSSLNRPGGSVTGVHRQTVELTTKRLDLISELAPNATKVGLLVNPKAVQTPALIQEMQEGTTARAPARGQRVQQGGAGWSIR